MIQSDTPDTLAPMARGVGQANAYRNYRDSGFLTSRGAHRKSTDSVRTGLRTSALRTCSGLLSGKGDGIPHLKPSDSRALASAGGPAVNTRNSGVFPELIAGFPRNNLEPRCE